MSEPRTWTILEVLEFTRGHFEKKGIQPSRLDAEVLLAHVLGIQRVMLYARFDQPMQDAELTRARELVARRARGEPMAYLLGTREFWSLDLEVTSDTLIPRPDTETLVEVAVDAVKGRPPSVVVDVGTGTGCIALALAKELPNAAVYALEVSDAARSVAERNVAKHGLSDRVKVLPSDLLDGLALDVGPIELLVSNLPYIPSGDIPNLMVDVRAFEPHLALDGGRDGLELIRRLIEAAPARMAAGGAIGLEAGDDQIEAVGELLKGRGFVGVELHRDAAGLLRVAIGRKA